MKIFGEWSELTDLKLRMPAAGQLTLAGTNSASSFTATFQAATGTVALTNQPLSQFASTTSAQLLATISDANGTGTLVFGTNATLVTPNLGTPSTLVLTNATGTPTSIGLANGTGLPIAGGTTGTLPVARGGTGDITLTPDGVLYGNGTGAIGATAAGTTGQVLTATTGSAPTWTTLAAAPGTATPTVQGLVTSYAPIIQSAVKSLSSAGYTITTTDGYEAVVVSTGASSQVVTLPAASANTGRVLYFKKTDAGAGAATITAAGSDLIDGNATYSLTGQNDAITLVDDGTGWRVMTSSSVEIDVDEVNAVTNPIAAVNLAAVTDGTSSTTTRVTAGSPLNPVVPTAFSAAASANTAESATSGSYQTFTMPVSLYQVMLAVSLYVQVPAGPDVWAISVYAGATRMTLSTDLAGVSNLPAGTTGQYRTTFSATSATTYTVHLTRTAGSGTTSLIYTRLVVGPGVTVQGAAVGPWTAYTPTIGGAASAISKAYYRRVGDTMELKCTFTLTTPSGSQFNISLPTGTTINYAALGTTQSVVGTSTANISSTNTAENVAYAFIDSSIANLIVVGGVANGSAGSGTLTALAGGTPFSTAVQNAIFATGIPINEWAGSGTVNIAQNDIQYYYSTGNTWGTSNSSATTSQGLGGVLGGTSTPAGTFFNYQLTPTTPIPVGAIPQLEVSSDQISWSPLGASLSGSAGIIENLRNDGTNYIGASVSVLNGGKLNVGFGKYAYGTSGAWNGTWYWRVAVGLPGQAVGFGQQVPGVSAGLVPAAGLTGNTTGNAIAAGTVGQQLNNNPINPVPPGASTFFVTVASIPVPAGVWLLTGSGALTVGTATTLTTIAVGISTINGGNPDAFNAGNVAFTDASGATASELIIPGCSRYVNISSAATYYLVCRADYVSVGTAKWAVDSFLQAIRLA